MNELHKPGRWAAAVAALLIAAMLPAAASAIPDLNGTWKITAPQSSFSPASGEIPFTAAGLALYQQHKQAAAAGDDSFDLTKARCSSPGLPRLMLTPDRFRVFQRDDVVMIAFEWNRLAREIDTTGTPPDPDFETMNGVSAGHWQGNVLVVDSHGFSDKKLIDNLMPNGEDLELTEHIRLRGHNVLEDRITIKDPAIFTKSWDTIVTYRRVPDQVFQEDVCLDRKAAGLTALPQ